jgi:hypothetical protein
MIVIFERFGFYRPPKTLHDFQETFPEVIVHFDTLNRKVHCLVQFTRKLEV